MSAKKELDYIDTLQGVRDHERPGLREPIKTVSQMVSDFVRVEGRDDAALLPTDPAERKGIPIASGVLDYFPAALAEIAKVSKAGNDQHNPGEPLHWARGKSMDQGDTLIRHFLERGTIDKDGLRHSAKMAWRALALLQLEMEEAGAPMARGASEV